MFVTNPSELVMRYKSDPESVYNTWFIDNDTRMKAFHSIRRGVMTVIASIKAETSGNDFKGSPLEFVLASITEQKQVSEGAAHPFYIYYLVSVRKGCFSALAVSIFGFACAAYGCTPPRNPSIYLPGQKIPRFPNRKPLASLPKFPDGNCLANWKNIVMDSVNSAMITGYCSSWRKEQVAAHGKIFSRPANRLEPQDCTGVINM